MTSDRRVDSTAQRLWRTYVPDAIRGRVNAVRSARRDSAWRKSRDLGDLRRTTPFSTWGASRGGSIARAYIAEFLEHHAGDIRGRALEVAGDEYIRKYGTGVTRVDILDVLPDNAKATIVADIADAPNVPDDSFDCVLITQLLSWVYDVRAPLRTAHRILRPGGVLLATTPGIARIAPVESELFGEWWHFTSMSAKRVTEEVFGEGNVEIESFGNVLAAAASLYGLGAYDVSPEELAVRDPAFELVVAIRAVKRD
jgi:SAM-dependent methyltransferase